MTLGRSMEQYNSYVFKGLGVQQFELLNQQSYLLPTEKMITDVITA